MILAVFLILGFAMELPTFTLNKVRFIKQHYDIAWQDPYVILGFFVLFTIIGYLAGKYSKS